MLITTTHPLPRAEADTALTLTDTLGEAIPTLALDVAEHPENPDLYQLTWFLDADHKPMFINELQNVIHLEHELIFTPVDESIDYVAATRAAFPPLMVGPFFIARNDEPAPGDMIGLSITPNRAFGSGEHATTRGCLESYLELADAGKTFTHGLDVGTGSAILALAVARHANVPFIGTDNDAPSVTIAQENATLNDVQTFQAVLDDNLQHPTVQTHSPYDLIFANILMLPLIELAPAISALLAPGGALILSGFTDDQQESVHSAYQAQGLRHSATRVIGTHGGNWCASTFIR